LDVAGYRVDETLASRKYQPTPENFLNDAGEIEAYEIHAGRIHYRVAAPAFSYVDGVDRAVHPRPPILGTPLVKIHARFAGCGCRL
jgi:hypothetical protein